MKNAFGAQVRIFRHPKSTGKHPTRKLMGFARRNRGNGVTNWTVLCKHFPGYKEQIKRTNDPVKMMELVKRPEKKFDVKVAYHQPG